jgi:hypothetical protein
MELNEQISRIKNIMGLNESNLDSVESTAEALRPILKNKQVEVTLRNLTNLIAHNGDHVITKFDSSKISGSVRGRYGKGYYFSSLFKNYDYGTKSTYLNSKPLNLLNGNLSISRVFYMLELPSDISSRINNLEDLLYNVKNNKEYNEITNEIENLKEKYSIFDRNTTYIINTLKNSIEKEPELGFDTFMESLESRVIETNRLNVHSSVVGLEDSLNNLILHSGFDGVIFDEGREIILIPQEKLNDFIVHDMELFISQKYHEAKQDGSNPELVSVIEKLLN